MLIASPPPPSPEAIPGPRTFHDIQDRAYYTPEDLHDIACSYPAQKSWAVSELPGIFPPMSRIEVLEGRLRILPFPTALHREIVNNVSFKLERYRREVGSGQFFAAPLELYFSPAFMLLPDVVFFAAGAACTQQGPRIEGVPTMALEVLNTPGAHAAIEQKMRIYAAAGVAECWTIVPQDMRVSVYARTQGHMALRHRTAVSGLICSEALPGFEVLVEEII